MFILRACLRTGGGGVSSTARNISYTSTKLLPTGSASASTTLDNIRSFSSDNNNNDGKKSGDDDNDQQADSNSFFLQNEDSFPAPPSYVRDAVTGKWTNQTLAELSSKERKILNLDDETKSEEVMARLGERWKEAASEAAAAADGESGSFGTLNKEHKRVAHRIQQQQLALGPIGRDPAGSMKKSGDNKNDDGIIDDSIEKPLTPREYQALKTYAQKEHNIQPKDFAKLSENDPDLIPHNTMSSGSEGSTDAKQFFDADLDLAYLNPRLNRRAFKDGVTSGGEDDDPFADLLPSDLNPARKVNRQHAKLLPKKLLHHNNLSLLRRYTTPGGKIMNRVQSRLGAKDQRKIAKLVKRARHMGLIPHIGQWKFEDHGYLYERGLEDAADVANVGDEAEGKRDWEVELEKRGLWPLQDETELVKRFYDMEKMMDHIAGPKGGKKRDELDMLLGGAGALVGEDKKVETDGSVGNSEGGSVEQGNSP
mmetsp:Transcript_29214/g.62117  ORF Transcript_29214/g.62117 Transcript_29214/m.62117 type:complete len:481 (-) Transcript_29214:83-1525(-)